MHQFKKTAITLSLCLASLSQFNIANASEITPYKDESTIVGSAPQTRTGWSMANVGHFSSLDREDLAVTSSYAAGNNNYAAYILFGTTKSSFPTANNIDELGYDEVLKIVIPPSLGANNRDRLTIQKIGDLNGDGYDELALIFSGNSYVYVIWGGPQNRTGTRASNQINLDDIDRDDNRRGFRVYGNDGSWFGTAASGIRYSAAAKNDASKNLVDLAIGNIAGVNGRGSVSVIYGRKDTEVGNWKNIDFVWEGNQNNDTRKLVPKDKSVQSAYITSTYGTQGYDSAYATNPMKPANVNLGAQLTSVGDINGDGQDDYVIVDPYAQTSVSNGNYGGTAYLVFGNKNFTTSYLSLNSLNKNEAIRLHGMANAYLGQASTNEGIISNQTVVGHLRTAVDTAPDAFAISSPYYTGSDGKRSGIVWVIKGKPAGETIGFDGTLALDAYHEVSGYKKQFSKQMGYAIRTTREAKDGMGFGAAITSLNTTICDEPVNTLVISDPSARRNGSAVGAVYVIKSTITLDNYADSDGIVAIEDLLDDRAASVYWGDAANNLFGKSVAAGNFFGADIGSCKPNILAIATPGYINNTGKIDVSNTTVLNSERN